jgi:hypothetical protein
VLEGIKGVGSQTCPDGRRAAPMKRLVSTALVLAILALTACAQGMEGGPAAPPGPPYDSGDKGGDGGGAATGM